MEEDRERKVNNCLGIKYIFHVFLIFENEKKFSKIRIKQTLNTLKFVSKAKNRGAGINLDPFKIVNPCIPHSIVIQNV